MSSCNELKDRLFLASRPYLISRKKTLMTILQKRIARSSAKRVGNWYRLGGTGLTDECVGHGGLVRSAFASLCLIFFAFYRCESSYLCVRQARAASLYVFLSNSHVASTSSLVIRIHITIPTIIAYLTPTFGRVRIYRSTGLLATLGAPAPRPVPYTSKSIER